MPAAIDDGQARVELLDGGGDFDGASDHRPGKHRDTKAQRVCRFCKDAALVVRLDCGIDYNDLETCESQSRCERQQAERCAKRRAIVRGIKENDFPAHQHATVSAAASNRLASTTGLKAAAVRSLSLLLIH